MEMELIVCFVDDSDFEHDLVRREIAPVASGLHFVQAHTFDQAKGMLGLKIPVLFLLDLWGRDVTAPEPYLLPRKELENKVSGFKKLEDVYGGLENFPGDWSNEFLKRLFGIVEDWRKLFEEVCDSLGQSRNYGLSNLRNVREDYPGVPAVFYTRKSLISDAVAVFQEGADGLFIKPTGRDDSETRVCTKAYASKLIEALALIVDRNIGNLRKSLTLSGPKLSNAESEMEVLIQAWKKFRSKST